MSLRINVLNTFACLAVCAAGLAPGGINKAYAGEPADGAPEQLEELDEFAPELGGGDAEVVGVETKAVKIPSKLHAKGLEVPARLVRPKWSKPVGDGPAILLMHGSGGLLQMPADLNAEEPCSDAMEEQFVRWGERLAELGYVVLMPSSYSPRGFCDMHVDTDRIPDSFDDRPERIAERLYDFDASARYLCDQKDVDCDRMGLMGFSHGASMVILALHWQIDHALDKFRTEHGEELDIDLPDLKPGRPDFKVGIAYYPGCGLDDMLPLSTGPQAAVEDKYFPTAPLHILHGDADPLIEHCDTDEGPGTRQVQAAQVSDALDKENLYHTTVYTGAHHGFDNATDGAGGQGGGAGEEDEENSSNSAADVAARDAALTVALKQLSTYL
jgi:dienelactone hydrolase